MNGFEFSAINFGTTLKYSSESPPNFRVRDDSFLIFKHNGKSPELGSLNVVCGSAFPPFCEQCGSNHQSDEPHAKRLNEWVSDILNRLTELEKKVDVITNKNKKNE